MDCTDCDVTNYREDYTNTFIIITILFNSIFLFMLNSNINNVQKEIIGLKEEKCITPPTYSDVNNI